MITSKRIDSILQRHEQLHDLLFKFQAYKLKRPEYNLSYELRFYGDKVEREVNTSCHCHPQCEWQEFGTKEEFGKWLDEVYNKQ